MVSKPSDIVNTLLLAERCTISSENIRKGLIEKVFTFQTIFYIDLTNVSNICVGLLFQFKNEIGIEFGALSLEIIIYLSNVFARYVDR